MLPVLLMASPGGTGILAHPDRGLLPPDHVPSLVAVRTAAPATATAPMPPAALSPAQRLPAALVSRIPPSTGPPLVALTFDDGPDPAFTARILELLAANHAKASFFVVGRQAQRFPDLVRAELAQGSTVEGHTWDHRQLPGLGDATFSAEVDRTDELLGRLIGHPVACVRPPYGRVDAQVVERLGGRGLTTAMWDVDPRDWARPGARAIAARVLGRIHPGAVVVLHDGGGDRSQTVAALSTILDGIAARGYMPVPLCT